MALFGGWSVKRAGEVVLLVNLEEGDVQHMKHILFGQRLSGCFLLLFKANRTA